MNRWAAITVGAVTVAIIGVVMAIAGLSLDFRLPIPVRVRLLYWILFLIVGQVLAGTAGGFVAATAGDETNAALDGLVAGIVGGYIDFASVSWLMAVGARVEPGPYVVGGSILLVAVATDPAVVGGSLLVGVCGLVGGLVGARRRTV